MTISALIDTFEKRGDPSWQESWDNCGWQVEPGVLTQEAKVLVCLTPTATVLEEAINEGFNLIFAHHPLIFRGIKSLEQRDPLGGMILRAAAQGIGIYSAHTNFDQIARGTACLLAQAIGLGDTWAMEITGEGRGYGRVADLSKPISLQELLTRVQVALKPERLLHSPAPLDTLIRRVACLGGSGASYLDQAVAASADAYITADVKFHQFQEARDKGVVLIDAGHYATERPAMAGLVEDFQALGVRKVKLSQADEDFRAFAPASTPTPN